MGASPRSNQSSHCRSSDSDDLVEFFTTELEKHQANTAALSQGQRKLHDQLRSTRREMKQLQGELEHKMASSQELLRQMEHEFIHGQTLRSEEKQLARVQQRKSESRLRQHVNAHLGEWLRQQQQHQQQAEDAFDKKMVDVVVENQALKAENMELKHEIVTVGRLAIR